MSSRWKNINTQTIALIKAKIISNTKIKKYAEISNLNYGVGLL